MYKKLILFLASLGLVSCSAINTSISKSDLVVNTRLTNSIFLEPVAQNNRTIFVQVRSTANDFYLQPALEARLRAKGYKIVYNPKLANFIIQANVRQFTRSVRPHDSTLDTVGGAILGGALGSAFGGGGGRIATTAVGAVAGGAAGNAIGKTVEDVTYTAIVDVQISQRVKGTITYRERGVQRQGANSIARSNYTRNSSFAKYRTQVISTANQADLTRQQATPAIVMDIVNALSGLF